MTDVSLEQPPPADPAANLRQWVYRTITADVVRLEVGPGLAAEMRSTLIAEHQRNSVPLVLSAIMGKPLRETDELSEFGWRTYDWADCVMVRGDYSENRESR